MFYGTNIGVSEGKLGNFHHRSFLFVGNHVGYTHKQAE
jgi:hypothetical protein